MYNFGVKDNAVESDSGSGQKSSELAVPNPEETIEFPIEPIKIPFSWSKDHTIIEPSEEELKEFFTPDVIQRLVYCSQINRDMTDDQGMFGYEPGYIFVNSRKYEGAQTLADEGMLKAKTIGMIKTASGAELIIFPHYDYFPRHKFSTQLITAERTPKTFAFLRHLLENVDPNDISTFPTDDLHHELKGLRFRLSNQRDYLGMAEKYRKIANNEDLSPEQRQDALMFVDKSTERYVKAQEQIPQDIERYLSFIKEFQGRKEVTSPELRLFGSFKEEQTSIQAAIDQAEQRGDNKLANAIKKLQEETDSYREGRVYLSPETNKKTPGLGNGK